MSNRKVTAQIKELLRKNPEGLSITEIVRSVRINRNTAAGYLEKLLVSGQVQMRHFGMAKIYTLSRRVPLSAVLSMSSDLIMQLDSGLRIVFCNDPFLRLMSASPAEIFGKNIEFTPVATIFEDMFPEIIHNLREGLAGKEWTGEMALMSGNLLFLSRIAPTVFDDGHKGVTVILEDITERKHAEDALRESEERYRTLVEIFPDAIILHCGGRIVYLNPAALSLFGATCSDEIIGKNILDFIHPAFRDTVLKNIKKDLRGESTPLIELQIIRTDGTPVTVEGRGVGTSINGKPAIQVAIRDITERRHAEEALYENEERFRKIFENSPVGMALVLPDFRFRMVNPRLCRMLGYPRNKLLTMSFTDITHPDDVVKDVEQVKKFGTGDLEIYKTEKRYLKSDGSVITASVTVSPVKDNRNRMMYAVALIEESPGSGRAVKKRRKIKKR